MAAHAQQGEGGVASSGGAIQPRLGVSLTWTDNLHLSDQNKDATIITTVSPGISITRNSGSLRGSLDYSLNGITYLKSSQGSQIQNALNANGKAEIIPGTFYVDAAANIGQQNTSAFGLQSAPTLGSNGSVSPLDNANRSETGTLSVSPTLVGQLAGVASFDLRGTASVTEVRGSSLGDSRGGGVSLRISQLAPGTLSWYAVASTSKTKSYSAPSNGNSSVMAGLNYIPDPDWAFSVNAGQERSDFARGGGGGSNSQSGFTGGVTANWAPTPRTNLNSSWQRHRYGNSHGLNLTHRMVNSVVTLSDNTNLMLGNTGANGGIRTVYDLYFLMFAGVEPDPVKRDALVRAYLASVGLSPDAPLSSGFLSTGPSRSHNQSLNVALRGVRTSITGLISRTVTTRLGENLNQGDLANNARIEQRSYSLTATYQLSPVSSAAVTASRQQSFGEANGISTQLTSLTANWNGRLGSRISVQLGGRHSRFEGATSYSENAAYGTLTQQF